MKNILKISLSAAAVLLSGVAFAQSGAQRSTLPEVSERLAAAREGVARRVAEAQAKAGDPSAPQVVSDSEIPSYERLKRRFELVAEQLKPEFVSNMTKPAELASLAELGCTAEQTLPVGTEFEPGKLDGTMTLFKCDDGSYGRLEVKQPFTHPTKVRELSKSALNDQFGTTPAVGRYKRTESGIRQSILRWDGTSRNSITLDLVASRPEATAARASGTTSIDPAARIKQMAEKINAAK